ncbi:MAG: tRNA uridine-5-carboxymethylaminomethyl(34) synthesis GTPase MnmE, partial [Thermodesulfobacteriota bacterium]|nr:tRNA uridine-5-carboxymethylaminomethyl(34) synthesis GTPase MnmE [Thermodesulfobacteriota bacterium]
MSGDFASFDTIAAIATPLGIGGIGIVRVSGPSSLSIATRLFTSAHPDFKGFKPHRLHHGVFSDQSGASLDEVLAAYMPGPHSYTGEDVIEIHCHGGPAAVGSILEAVLDSGARTASPGEFTLRAYLNGRMDLTQAEAVAEMIAAPTKAGLTLAQAKLDGALGRKITGLRNTLEDLRAKLCVAVDFPEDEVECLSPEEFTEGVDQVIVQVAGLVQNFEQNKCWSQGVLAVLAGRVNAGKSSLLNALLGRNRALVADMPGTTRDYLEESLNLDGLLVRVIDTAGLRETKDAIELAGVEKSKDLTAQADLVLLVIDQAAPLDDTDLRFANHLGAEKTLGVLNKSDLAAAS